MPIDIAAVNLRPRRSGTNPAIGRRGILIHAMDARKRSQVRLYAGQVGRRAAFMMEMMQVECLGIKRQEKNRMWTASRGRAFVPLHDFVNSLVQPLADRPPLQSLRGMAIAIQFAAGFDLFPLVPVRRLNTLLDRMDMLNRLQVSFDVAEVLAVFLGVV